MKIDPKIQFTNNSEPENVKNTRTSGTQSSNAQTNSKGISSASGEDTVSLSSAHGEIQTLAASVGNVPEVRTNRVNALQQQVRSGNYQPDNQQIADAIIADQSKLNVKA